MRFVRNSTLKKHLDAHFSKSNDSRRRGNRAVSRPAFLVAKDFVIPPTTQLNQKGAKGIYFTLLSIFICIYSIIGG
jgi:hypothetical protein